MVTIFTIIILIITNDDAGRDSHGRDVGRGS